MSPYFMLAGLAALAAFAAGASAGDRLAHAAQESPGYGVGGCPPGLAKKGCMPPGQAKKLYRVGHRFGEAFRGWTPYADIPADVRRHHGLHPGQRYIYDHHYIYEVDPLTLTVGRILDAAGR